MIQLSNEEIKTLLDSEIKTAKKEYNLCLKKKDSENIGEKRGAHIALDTLRHQIFLKESNNKEGS